MVNVAWKKIDLFGVGEGGWCWWRVYVVGLRIYEFKNEPIDAQTDSAHLPVFGNHIPFRLVDVIKPSSVDLFACACSYRLYTNICTQKTRTHTGQHADIHHTHARVRAHTHTHAHTHPHPKTNLPSTQTCRNTLAYSHKHTFCKTHFLLLKTVPEIPTVHSRG